MDSTKAAKFLSALTIGKSVSKACDIAGVSRRSVYYWRDENPEFADAWKDAVQTSIEQLEDEVRRRALDSNDKSSMLALMFLLKKANPEYRDNYKQEVKIDHGKVKEFDLSDAELEKALVILKSAVGKASDRNPDKT